MKNVSIGCESIVTKKRLLFEHVEKCGGTSVLKYLESIYGSEFIRLPEYNRYDGLDRFYGTYTPLCITGHGAAHLIPLLKELGYETAILLRDPIERVKSLYRFCKQEGFIDYASSVQQFLVECPDASNYYAWRYSGIPSTAVGRCRTLARDLALRNLVSFDHIGFTHNISGFIDHLGFGVPYSGERENVTRYEELIGPEDTELITAANQIDIEIYNIISRLDTR